MIGLILFLVPTVADLSKQALTGYVLTTLYLMGPLAGVLSSLALFSRAEVALRKVKASAYLSRNIRPSNVVRNVWNPKCRSNVWN